MIISCLFKSLKSNKISASNHVCCLHPHNLYVHNIYNIAYMYTHIYAYTYKHICVYKTQRTLTVTDVSTGVYISVFKEQHSNDFLLFFSLYTCFVELKCCPFLHSYYMFLGCCSEKVTPLFS